MRKWAAERKFELGAAMAVFLLAVAINGWPYLWTRALPPLRAITSPEPVLKIHGGTVFVIPEAFRHVAEVMTECSKVLGKSACVTRPLDDAAIIQMAMDSGIADLVRMADRSYAVLRPIYLDRNGTLYVPALEAGEKYEFRITNGGRITAPVAQ